MSSLTINQPLSLSSSVVLQNGSLTQKSVENSSYRDTSIYGNTCVIGEPGVNTSTGRVTRGRHNRQLPARLLTIGSEKVLTYGAPN